MLSTCLRWNASARAHVHTHFPDLTNGWADCAQIWCVARDPLDKCFTHVWCGIHLHVRTCTPVFQISQTAGVLCSNLVCCYGPIIDKCFTRTRVWGVVHLHVRTCTPLGFSERRLVKLPATRTTNLRSAALHEKRCLAGHRRLVEHGDNNYSLELLFSQWETNLSYRNRALNKQLCWRLPQVDTLFN